MALAVTEDWIRERVGLKHNNLEDVRSLSLPGTYHEKIGSFGEAMRKFTRLKSLDLSRNAIESLAGLESMNLLEKLNLYYNGIASLQELYRLRYNTKLQDLDLRLNPVARNEPDYRLFLIHMLPNLRRLDDRSVRDSERKAALMHFSTDQATDLTEHPRIHKEEEQPANPRVEHVKSLAKPPNVLDDDDVQLLEFMNPRRGELTGSVEKQAAMEEYPPQTLRDINRAGIGMEQAQPITAGQQQQQIQQLMQQTQQGFTTDNAAVMEFQAKYPNLPVMNMPPPSLPPADSGTVHGLPAAAGFDLHDNQQRDHREDPNLKYQDEIEAYTAFKTQGHFTPNPDNNPEPPVQNPAPLEVPNTQRSVELYTAEDLEKDLQKLSTPGVNNSHPQSSRGPQQAPTQRNNLPIHTQDLEQEEPHIELTGDTGEFIQKVSVLVDKYWNGSKSLLKNVRFKGQMSVMLKQYRQANNDTESISSVASTNASIEFELSRMKHSMEKVKKENEDLKEKLFQVPHFENLGEIDESTLKHSYMKAQRDVKILRDRLQKCIEDNKNLQNQLAGAEPHTSGGQSAGQPHMTAHGHRGEAINPAEIDTIQKENNDLRRQIESLNIKVKQFHQMQELAAMLQQSHKSLVQTNDHLLKEMEETRQRHKNEVQQLNWNFNQYKRTVGQQMYGGSQQANVQGYGGQ